MKYIRANNTRGTTFNNSYGRSKLAQQLAIGDNQVQELVIWVQIGTTSF
jgi:hypothetical protein